MEPGRVALLVVDVQRASVERGPYAVDEVLRNIASLLAAARAGGVDVIFVQHDGMDGSAHEPETEGWEIADAVRPLPDEHVVRKRYNSAFRDTDLEGRLRERGIETLILTGIQTEYCVDTTCRVGFEIGFDIVIPEMTNTTFDNGDVTARQIYTMYNRRIFDGRFATVRPIADVLRELKATADRTSTAHASSEASNGEYR